MKKSAILAFALAASFAAGAARADLDRIRAAAEAGNAEAQLELGILFQYGFNYRDNEIPALTWYMLSANQGNAKAASLRDTLKAKMSEKEVNEAMEQVAQYKPKGSPAPYETLREPAPAARPSAPAPAEPATAPPPAEGAPIPETAPPAAPQ
jgi:TPR repeat protein